MTRRIRAIAAAVTATAAVAGPPPAAAPAATPPVVDQMVVFRDGTVRTRTVRARATTVRVGRRRCAVAAGTALAALARSRVASFSLRDFGACSRRARDAGQLLVTRIGPDRNRGSSGWVYKVGNRSATAGSADASGPFGRGRLRRGARITWFYCRSEATSGACQRTLATSASADAAGNVTVRVRAYDNDGRSVPAAGATVRVGATAATAGEDGVAQFTVAPGATYRIRADLAGTVPAFPRTVRVG